MFRFLPLLVGLCLLPGGLACHEGETLPPPGDPPPHPSPEPAAEPSIIPLGGQRFRLGSVEFDKAARTLTIPASVLMRENAVEYLLVTRSGKVHESVFVTDCPPRDIHVAALLLGMKPSAELGAAHTPLRIPPEAAMQIQVEWDRNGPPARKNLHEMFALSDADTTASIRPVPPTLWLYNGSRIDSQGTFTASRDGSVISIIRDPDALINYPGNTRDNDDIHLPHAAALPKPGHPVRLVLKLR